MPEIEVHAVGSRGPVPDEQQREQSDTDTVSESKDEAPPGSLEWNLPGSMDWKELPEDDSPWKLSVRES